VGSEICIRERDKGWEILAECFTPEETRMKTDLINKFWPEEAK